MYGRIDTFNRGPITNYNTSNTRPQNGQNKLGSYRTNYKQEQPLAILKEIQPNWNIDGYPYSIMTKSELLHLTSTELRYEDYYLITNKRLTSTHQAKLTQAIKSNSFNAELSKNVCPLNLMKFSEEANLDLQALRYARIGSISPSGVNRNNANNAITQNSNNYSNNNSNMYHNSSANNSSNNVFMRNNTNTNNNTSNTNQNGINIFNRNSTNTNTNTNNNSTNNNNSSNNSNNVFMNNNSAGKTNNIFNNTNNSSVGNNQNTNTNNIFNNNSNSRTNSNNNNTNTNGTTPNIFNGNSSNQNTTNGNNQPNNNIFNSNNNSNTNNSNTNNSNSNNSNNNNGNSNTNNNSSNTNNIFSNNSSNNQNNNNNSNSNSNNNNNIFSNNNNNGNTLFGNNNNSNNNNNNNNNLFNSNHNNSQYNLNSLNNQQQQYNQQQSTSAFNPYNNNQSINSGFQSFLQMTEYIVGIFKHQNQDLQQQQYTNNNNYLHEPLHQNTYFSDIDSFHHKWRRDEEETCVIIIKQDSEDQRPRNSNRHSKYEQSKHETEYQHDKGQNYHKFLQSRIISKNSHKMGNELPLQSRRNGLNCTINNSTKKSDLHHSNKSKRLLSEKLILSKVHLNVLINIKWLDLDARQSQGLQSRLESEIYFQKIDLESEKGRKQFIEVLKVRFQVIRKDGKIEEYSWNRRQNIVECTIMQNAINLNEKQYTTFYTKIRDSKIYDFAICRFKGKSNEANITWDDPIDLTTLDFSGNSSFSITENTYQWEIPALDSNCRLSFKLLPDKIKNIINSTKKDLIKKEASQFLTKRFQTINKKHFQGKQCFKLLSVWQDGSWCMQIKY